jgi:hypothetical protein
MKNLILVLTVGLFITNTTLGQNTSKSFELVDHSTMFNKVDSLKLDEHTEFAMSVLLVNCKNQEEIDLVVNKLGNKEYPKEFVEFYSNKTYYPKTEHINDNTSKKFNSTFVYVDNTESDTKIYVLRPSGKMEM